MKLLRSLAIGASLCLALGGLALAQSNPGASPQSILKGGTGATTASGARTALGLAIGTNVQAYHARLSELAAISWAQGDIVYFNGTNLVRLAAGTSGQYLKTLGTGANPLWATVSAGGSPFTDIEFRPTGSAAADYFTMSGVVNGFMTAYLKPSSQGYGAFDLIPNCSGGCLDHTNAGRMWMDILGTDAATSSWATRVGAKVDGGGVDIGYIGTWKQAGGSPHAASVPLAVILDTSTEVARFKTTGFTAIGTTTNDSAAAGYIGEYVSSSILVGSQVSLTSTVVSNVTSISLTAGDWDVSGNVIFNFNGSTNATLIQAGFNSTSVTYPTAGLDTYQNQRFPLPAGVPGASADPSLTLARGRISLSGTTTVYLMASSTFSAGTVDAYGFISARRVR